MLQRGLATTPGIDGPADLFHDKRFPEPDLGRPPGAVVDEVLREAQPSHTTVDVRAELWTERDGSVQQERRYGVVLEVAGDRERFRHCGQIVPAFIERGADGVEIAKRSEEFERGRKQSFPPKQL